MQQNKEKLNRMRLSELVKGMGIGDQSALLEFYDATGPFIYGQILEIIKDPPAAEEVLIETYTNAWREASFFSDGSTDPFQWLSAIARTCALIRHHDLNPIRADEGARTTPPFFLRDLIANRIEHESNLARSLESSRELIEAALATTETPVRGHDTPKKQHIFWWAVAAMLTFAGVALFIAWHQARIENARLAAGVGEDRETIGKLRAALDSAKEGNRELAVLDEVLQSPGLRIIPLASQQPETPGSGSLFWDVENRRIVVAGFLPPPSFGMAYQLWFVAGGRKLSGGLLDTDESGRTFAVLDARVDIEQVDLAGVTLEPNGGSQEPTTRFKLLGNLK